MTATELEIKEGVLFTTEKPPHANVRLRAEKLPGGQYKIFFERVRPKGDWHEYYALIVEELKIDEE